MTRWCSRAERSVRLVGVVGLAAVGLVACAAAEGAPPPTQRSCVEVSECAVGEACLGGVCTATTPPVVTPPGPRPRLRLLTPSITFTDVPRGRTAEAPARLENLGDANLSISRVDVLAGAGGLRVSPAPGEFAIELPPQAVLTLTASFTAEDGAPRAGSIVVHSNDPVAPRTTVPVAIQYTGVPLPVLVQTANGQHAENLDGEDLDLGFVPAVGGRTVTLFAKNLGVGGAFAVLEAPRSEDPAVQVRVLENADGDGRHRLSRYAAACAGPADCNGAVECTANACRLADGSYQDLVRLEVHAEPAVGAAVAAWVSWPWGAAAGPGGGTLRLRVRARGVDAGPILAPAELIFAPVSVGYPASDLLILTNASLTSLAVLGLAVEGSGALANGGAIAAAVLEHDLPYNLSPFEALAIRVDFAALPSLLGPQSAEVVVDTGAAELRVPVSGVARIGPAVEIEPLSSLTFTPAHVGEPSLASLVLRNVAAPPADDLHILDAFTVTLGGAASFLLPSDILSVAVSAEADASIELTCVPGATGEATGLLTLTFDAPDNPVRHLPLRCVGIDPTLEVRYETFTTGPGGALDLGLEEEHPCRASPELYPSPCADFGNLYLGGGRAIRVVLVNTGVGPLGISTPLLSGDDFLLATSVPPVLAAGAEVSLEIDYVGPASPGTSAGSLSFDHTDADRAPVSLGLLGSTAACEITQRDCSASQQCLDQQTATACCPEPEDPEACLPGCLPCEPRSHTSRACVSDTCSYTCVPGYVDVNGGLDGCEYACVPRNGGVETCDGRDEDCDGWLDEELPLGDAEGIEAPAVCSPASAAGLLGLIEDDDLGAISLAGGGALSQVVSYSGRLYTSTGDPGGDVDWLRLLFSETSSCDAVGFRMVLSLEPPAGRQVEICASVADPEGAPLFPLPCREAAGEPVFEGCAIAGGSLGVAEIVLEWPEHCGSADDRVIDLRLRSPSDAGSCAPYGLRVDGARLF